MRRNLFLNTLDPEIFRSLEPHLRQHEMPLGNVLYDVEQRIERAYFPFTGAVSFVVGIDGQYVEAGLIGKNGVAGAGAALGDDIALNRAVSQLEGHGAVIDIDRLTEIADGTPRLSRALFKNEQALHAHAQQAAACNATHAIDPRLCRWLLLAQDLAGDDTLALTHEFLSQMLGVNRSTVTLAAGRLQDAGVIKTRRGRINIKKPAVLYEASCGCDRAVNRHLLRLTGWNP